MQQVPVAGSVACSHCGGRFERLPRTNSMFCPYCGTKHTLAPELFAGLEAYRADVARQVASANAAYDEAAAYDPNAQPKGATSMVIVLIVGTPVMLLIGLGLAGLGYIKAETVALAYGGIWTAFAFYKQYVDTPTAVAERQKRAAEETAKRVKFEALQVSCPCCGAPAELLPGQTAASCRYCRGVLMSSDLVAARGRAQAAQMQHLALQEKFRQERRALAKGKNVVVLAAFAGVIQVALLLYFLTSRADGRAGALMAVLTVPVLVALLGAWLWVGAMRRRRALDRVARTLRGNWRFSVRAVIEWLNTFWLSEYDSTYLEVTRCWSLAAGIHSFPLLFHYMPAKPVAFILPTTEQPQLNVLLACDLGAGASTPALWTMPAVRPLLERCRSAGFAVEVTPAGLLASATDELRMALGKSAEELQRAPEVGSDLYRIAIAVGARPAVR